MNSALELRIYKKATELLRVNGLNAKDPKIAQPSKARHIRIQNSIEEIQHVIEQISAELDYDNVPRLSGKFKPFSITFSEECKVQDLAGFTIYALSNLKGNARVSQKQLIPAKLGLGCVVYKKSNLVQTLQRNIPAIVKDQVVQQFLLQLVDVAIGKKSAVDSLIMSQLDPDTIRMTGIDFGEVLTPLILSRAEDTIVFPSGNSMLTDVEINSKPFSVKSASGSGTSFKAIHEHMDTFQNSIQLGNIVLTQQEQKIYSFFRMFIDTSGHNVDKIIAASAAINTPEHQKLAQIIGKTNFIRSDLVEFSKKFNDYSTFLKQIYPVSIAGNYIIKNKIRPNGMPRDHRYYMGLSEIQPESKETGKPSWDADQGNAGANILTYILGTSFLADSRKTENRQQYSQMIKKILGNVHANVAKIDITRDGKIKIKHASFDQLEYEFQYHAPSSKPGNNLPGFSFDLTQIN